MTTALIIRKLAVTIRYVLLSDVCLLPIVLTGLLTYVGVDMSETGKGCIALGCYLALWFAYRRFFRETGQTNQRDH